jgi:hypothetical protein
MDGPLSISLIYEMDIHKEFTEWAVAAPMTEDEADAIQGIHLQNPPEPIAIQSLTNQRVDLPSLHSTYEPLAIPHVSLPLGHYLLWRQGFKSS